MKNNLEHSLLHVVKPAVVALVDVLLERDVTALDVSGGGLRIAMVRGTSHGLKTAASLQSSNSIEQEAGGPHLEESAETALVPVTSELVGRFMLATPSHSAVKVGDSVAQGDVLCYIESMKLMNEVRAPIGGRVLEILVEAGHPVEYGQALMALMPEE